jgi:hypothetical protein
VAVAVERKEELLAQVQMAVEMERLITPQAQQELLIEAVVVAVVAMLANRVGLVATAAPVS